MRPGFVFTFLRLLQLATLIPTWSLLAVFVDRYQPLRPPEPLLFLFVVAIMATAWAAITLLMYRRMLWTPLYVAVVDFVVFALLVAGVVLLAPVRECVGWDGVVVGVGAQVNHGCLILKSAWGLGLLGVVLFIGSTLVAGCVWRDSGLVFDEGRERTGRVGRKGGFGW